MSPTAKRPSPRIEKNTEIDGTSAFFSVRGAIKQTKWLLAVTLALFATVVYLNNASFLATPIGTDPFLIAHRALDQGFDHAGLTATNPPSHTTAYHVPALSKFGQNLRSIYSHQ